MGKIKRLVNKTRKLLNVDFDSIVDNNINSLHQINELKKKEIILSNKIDNLSKSIDSLNSNFDYTNLELMLSLNKQTSKKKVLICGYYGAFNLGDELMLQTILKYIGNKEELDITIMLCTYKYTDITKYGKYSFIHYPKTIHDFNYIAQYYDAVIFGGGALLDDSNYSIASNHLSLGYILINLTLRFIAFNKITILYGLSSNENLHNQEFIDKLNFIASNATYFSLRDTNSLNTLKACNIKTDRIKIVDDILFANNYNIQKRKTNSVVNIGVIYICMDDTEKDVIDNTRILIKYLKSNNIKYKINFIPFMNVQNNDEIFLKTKVGDMDKNITVLPYQYTIKDVVNTINDQDFIISMRYHGSLIANILEKNNITILYSRHRHYKNKMNYLYDNYGFEKNMVEKLDKKSLDKMFKSKFIKGNYSVKKAQDDMDNALKNLDR